MVGQIKGRSVYSFSSSSDEPPIDEVVERASMVWKKWAQLDDSDPGLVVSKTAPDKALYEHAVKRIITKEEALDYVRDAGGVALELNAGMGVIGSASAMSWVPMDRTYEILAYRREERWGTVRQVSQDCVARLDRSFPSTFNNYDREADRPAIVPHTSCPILYGVRGDNFPELIAAMRSMVSEPLDRWLIYITNQGTDAHIIHDWKVLEPNASYDIECLVNDRPYTRERGHVIFSVDTVRTGEKIECAAYEPSKGFRNTIRMLRPGDRLRVFGELREAPRTLNLEKIQIISLARSYTKVANPTCPECGKRMKSAGKGQGYRCKSCSTETMNAETEPEDRKITIGWYEPPVCARRHLAKPLKREGMASVQFSAL